MGKGNSNVGKANLWLCNQYTQSTKKNRKIIPWHSQVETWHTRPLLAGNSFILPKGVSKTKKG